MKLIIVYKLILLFFIALLISSCSTSNKIDNRHVTIQNVNYLISKSEFYIKRNNYKSALPYLHQAYENSVIIDDNLTTCKIAFSITKAYYILNIDSLFDIWNIKYRALCRTDKKLFETNNFLFNIDTLYYKHEYDKLAKIDFSDQTSQTLSEDYIIALSKITYAGFLIKKPNFDYLNFLQNIGVNNSVFSNETKAYICFIISEIFVYENKFNEAVLYLKTGLDLARVSEYYILAAKLSESIGNLYFNLNNLEYLKYYAISSDFYLLCNDNNKANELLLKCKQ
ncbi:MAG TPA: hypothetical protein PL041_13705 [Melioribacteraceae bacterium]|nr:hypothetical protein [Melioribacteraceae bacterium]